MEEPLMSSAATGGPGSPAQHTVLATPTSGCMSEAAPIWSDYLALLKHAYNVQQKRDNAGSRSQIIHPTSAAKGL